MAEKTPNFNLTKPLSKDFYDVEVQNNNMDIIDAILKNLTDSIDDFNSQMSDANTNLGNHLKASNPHKITASNVGLGLVPNVATNDQTPTYTEASKLETLTSGEKISVAFGKIKCAITDLIKHLNNKSNPHGVTAPQIGAATKNELLEVSNTANDAYELADSAVKIATGSYVGTGGCGSTNPSTLNFNFVPKFVAITIDDDIHLSNAGAFFIQGQSESSGIGHTGNSDAYSRLSIIWKDNSVSWYYHKSIDGSGHQLNTSGATYRYVAFG